jgi:hypothetical protein
LIILLLLAALGPIAYNVSMISNLLDQSGSHWYLFTVSFAAFLLAFTCIATLNLTLLYGRERFDEARHSGLSQKRPLLTFLLGCAAAAVLDVCVYLRTRPLDAWNILVLALGFVASFVLVIAAKLVQLALTDPKVTPHPPPYLIFPAYISESVERLFDGVYCWSSNQSRSVKGAFNWLSQWPLGILRHAGQGYLVRHEAGANEPLRLLAGHVFAATLAVIAFCTYLGMAFYKAQITAEASRVPALAFVLLSLIVACWTLAALAFFFDRYRFPLFWILLILSGITWSVPQSDHFFRVEEFKNPLSDAPTAAEYLATRLKHPAGGLESPHRRLVFVATPGGGIQAAAWTAQVLTSLNSTPDSAFRNSVAVISSVSGGSLGSIVYGASFAGNFPIEQVPSNASQSAIDEIAWGLTAPDFWRAVIPWLRIDRAIDRGWALEKKWAAINKLRDTGGRAGTMLSQWSEMARKGAMPALIINSMIAERGQPVVFSTTRFPRERSSTGRIVNFYDLYAGRPGGYDRHYDIRVNTAARLSASFPYVAPASRPSLDSPFGAGFHIVDGGYYDNFGMNSLLSWLDEGLGDPCVRKQLPDVLILQIRPFNPSALDAPKQHGWGLQLVAPLLGLYNMRDFAQNSVAKNQLAFFGKYYRTQGVNVWKVSVDYNGTGECAEAPLSWKLDVEQQRCIPKTWKDDVLVKQKLALECIDAYVKGQDPAGKCSPAEAEDKE